MIYEYQGCCSSGKHVRVCSLAEYEADPSYSCPSCGRGLERIISAPRFLCNTKPFEPFKSTVDGSIITCERELREHNKRNNVVNIHEGYDEKGLKDLTKKDFNKELDKERSKDLKQDMAIAVEKLHQGYKPQPAIEGDLP